MHDYGTDDDRPFKKFPSPKQYPRQKVIAVDFDGTLYRNGGINERLVEWCRRKRAEGFSLILWSARGQELCERAVTEFKLQDVFNHVISKPGYIVDDWGWRWVKFTKVIRTSDDL